MGKKASEDKDKKVEDGDIEISKKVNFLDGKFLDVQRECEWIKRGLETGPADMDWICDLSIDILFDKLVRIRKRLRRVVPGYERVPNHRKPRALRHSIEDLRDYKKYMVSTPDGTPRINDEIIEQAEKSIKLVQKISSWLYFAKRSAESGEYAHAYCYVNVCMKCAKNLRSWAGVTFYLRGGYYGRVTRVNGKFVLCSGESERDGQI